MVSLCRGQIDRNCRNVPDVRQFPLRLWQNSLRSAAVAFKPEKTLGPVRLPSYANHPVSLKQKALENNLATAH